MEQSMQDGIYDEISSLQKTIGPVEIGTSNEKIVFFHLKQYFLERGFGIDYFINEREQTTYAYNLIFAWVSFAFLFQFLSALLAIHFRIIIFFGTMFLVGIILHHYALKHEKSLSPLLLTYNDSLENIISYANAQKTLVLIGSRASSQKQLFTLQQKRLLGTAIGLFFMISFAFLTNAILSFFYHSQILVSSHFMIALIGFLSFLSFSFYFGLNMQLENPFPFQIDNLSGLAIYRELMNVLSLFPYTETTFPWMGMLYSSHHHALTDLQEYLRQKGLQEDVDIELLRLESFGVEPRLYVYVDNLHPQQKFHAALLNQLKALQHLFPLPILIRKKPIFEKYYEIDKHYHSLLITSFQLNKLARYSTKTSFALEQPTIASKTYTIILKSLISCLYSPNSDLSPIILSFIKQGEEFMNKYLTALSPPLVPSRSSSISQVITEFKVSPYLFKKIDAFYEILDSMQSEALTFLESLSKASSHVEYWGDLEFFPDSKDYALFLRALEASFGSSRYAQMWVTQRYGYIAFPEPVHPKTVFTFFTIKALLKISQNNPQMYYSLADQFLLSGDYLRIAGALDFYVLHSDLFLKHNPLFRISHIKNIVNQHDQYPYLVLQGVRVLSHYSYELAYYIAKAHLFNPYQVSIHNELLSFMEHAFPLVQKEDNYAFQTLLENYIETYLEGETVEHAKEILKRVKEDSNA